MKVSQREAKAMQDAIASSLYNALECDGGWEVEIADSERDMGLGDEPGVGKNQSNQFEVVLDGSSGEGDDYVEYQDYLVISVEHRRRVKIS